MTEFRHERRAGRARIPDRERIGVVGIGRMGGSVLAHLPGGTAATDRDPDRRSVVERAGAVWYDDVAALAAAVDVLVTVLPDRRTPRRSSSSRTRCGARTCSRPPRPCSSAIASGSRRSTSGPCSGGPPAGALRSTGTSEALLDGDTLDGFGIDGLVAELDTVAALTSGTASPVLDASAAVHRDALAEFGAVPGELLGARLLELRSGRVLRR